MSLLNDLLTVDNLVDAITEAGYAISIADATQVDMPLIFVNRAFCEITGYDLDEVKGKNCRFLQGVATESSAIDEIHTAIQHQQSCQVTLTNYTKHTQAYKVQLTLIPVFDEKGGLRLYIGFHKDVSQYEKLTHSLESKKKDFQIASYVDLINRQLIMSRTDLTGKIIDVSDFFCEISGYRREELIGQNHNIVRHFDMPKKVFEDLWEMIKRTETWDGELKNLRKDGSYYWIETRISPEYDYLGNHIGYMSISIDITAKKSLEEMAIRDEMTGLYNRRFYNQNIHKEIRRAKRQGLWLCFMMLDADNFKKYNDTYGHQAGDEVLKKLATVLKKVFKRAGDYCFRLGGEEFAVLFEVEHQKDAEIMAEAVCKAIYNQSIEHSGNTPWMRLTVSIGAMVMDPLNTYVEEEIYKYADEALYRAKDAGRNRVIMVEEHSPELF